MSLVDRSTGEVVVDLSPDDARVLTDRIKVGVEAVWHLIVEAYNGGAHRALGYVSWDDYCVREFGTSRIRLPREERQEVVASLRESGLSIRAIAAATGISDQTVQRDLSCSESLHDDTSEADVPAESPKVVGIDGKRYDATPLPKVKERAAYRSPLPDMARSAGWEFRKSIERLERIAADDRFSTNREQVAMHLRGHLSYAVEVCQDLLDQLDHQS